MKTCISSRTTISDPLLKVKKPSLNDHFGASSEMDWLLKLSTESHIMCLLSPLAFVMCYQFNAAYVLAWYAQKPHTCIKVIDGVEYVRPRFMIDDENHEFYACGHAIEVLGTYR